MASNRPSGINKDYGRRGYVESDPKDHVSRMKRVTDFAKQKVDGRLEKHSEWKRPYLEDDYPEMEYFWSPPYIVWPPWPWWTIPDAAIHKSDTYDPGEKECPPCAITCYNGYNCDDWGWCHMSIACWLPGQNISRDFSWGLEEVIPAGGIIEVEYDKPLSGCIRFKTDYDHTNDDDEVYVKVRYTDGAGQHCYDTLTLKCVKECCIPTPPSFEWDTENSEDTVLRGDSAYVVADGGCPPYSWSVAGTGFTMMYAETANPANYVVADDTACGSATITVTDLCGSNATGTVREPSEGHWVLIDNQAPTACRFTGVGTLTASNVHFRYYELISGGKKQYQATRHDAGGSGGQGDECCVWGCPYAIGYCQHSWYCGGWCYPDQGCCVDNCIDPNDSWIPCYCPIVEWLPGCVWEMNCVHTIYYYEWEC